jgi:uncharacterized protein
MEHKHDLERSERFWNPYIAGVALGLVMLASFLLMGKGLGASGAANRVGVAALATVAEGHVEANPYMGKLITSPHGIFDNWLIFEVLGVFLGGIVAAYSAGRLKAGIVRGPRASIAVRLTMAVSGGILMGVAARIARGCTSGQALSGGAVLSVGSWIFMMAVFGGGYAVAYFVRRQWT